jgi:hypothetical protein
MLPYYAWGLHRCRHWVGMKLTGRLFLLQVLKIINTTAEVNALHLHEAGLSYR